MRRVWIGAAVAALSLSLASCASKSEVAELKKEVEALKAGQKQLAQQIGGRGRPANAPAAAPTPTTVDVGNGPIKGSTSTQVTLVEFSDYECPFCIRHFNEVMPLIEQNYIKTGKIRYAFRDFPIAERHPQAIMAHTATNCANEQGKFWPLHDKMFTASGTHKPEDLMARAREVGINTGTFNTCMGANKYTGAIQQSVGYAQSLGGTGTPFFTVGILDPSTKQLLITKVILGAQPYPAFQQALDAALAQK
jgi:protein-disulfide isomerase